VRLQLIGHKKWPQAQEQERDLNCSTLNLHLSTLDAPVSKEKWLVWSFTGETVFFSSASKVAPPVELKLF